MANPRLMNLTCMCLFAFAGGMSAQYFSGMLVSSSQAKDGLTMTSSPQSYRDNEGRVRMTLGMEHDEPQETMLGKDGKPRIVLGTDGKGDEKGLSSIALYDNQGRLKVRLHIVPGKNEPALMVMKDNAGHDRIVMGLNAEDPTEEPFFYYVDSTGQKHSVIGAF